MSEKNSISCLVSLSAGMRLEKAAPSRPVKYKNKLSIVKHYHISNINNMSSSHKIQAKLLVICERGKISSKTYSSPKQSIIFKS